MGPLLLGPFIDPLWTGPFLGPLCMGPRIGTFMLLFILLRPPILGPGMPWFIGPFIPP